MQSLPRPLLRNPPGGTSRLVPPKFVGGIVAVVVGAGPVTPASAASTEFGGAKTRITFPEISIPAAGSKFFDGAQAFLKKYLPKTPKPVDTSLIKYVPIRAQSREVE